MKPKPKTLPPLRDLHIKSGLSQRYVSNRIGISQTLYSFYLAGTRIPSPKRLAALKKILTARPAK